jgi:branched-chain amino acid transport system substrate-binding protein
MAWRTIGRGLATVTAVALLTAACGNSGSGSGTASDTTAAGSTTPSSVSPGDLQKNVPVQAPGVTPTEIHVGSVVSKTNPLGTDLANLNEGIKAYFDTINSAGGIYGRQLKLTSERDDQTGNNTGEVEALINQDNVYAAFIAVELFTGATELAQKGMPTFGWNINAEWADHPNLFPNVAPICFEGCPLQPHVLPTLVKSVGAHKVGVLAYNVPQAKGCLTGNLDNMKKFGPDVDAKVVYSDGSLQFGQTDYSAQVSKMKDAGVDFLVTCVDFNGDYAIAKEMARQGIRDKVTFYHANMYNQAFVKQNGKLLNNDIVLAQITAVEQNPKNDAQRAYLAYAKAHNLPISEMTMQGWIAAQQFVDALKATGPNFTWANLVDTWNREKWYSGHGWTIPIDWSKQHTNPAKGDQYRSEFECANFVRIENSAFVPYLAKPGKPWVCFDGHKSDTWQKPVNVSFDGAPFHMTTSGQQATTSPTSGPTPTTAAP